MTDAEEALRAHGDDLLAYLERRVGRDDAADALAETFATAWRRAADMPPDLQEARLWLFGVARMTAANTGRAGRRRSRLVATLRDAMVTAAPAADRGVEVRDAIARLEPDQAEVVRLRHWEGLTLAEAAVVLDEPASTVRSRYARARAVLAEALADEGVAD
ncbi:RNA polymerase sigma factor [Demequina sp. NBRC 110054]|uniref:RNA polymerase sigma factor n=1 Tax=Demequina sp. NBRC 110054 TaxID=1570343 RepID=UPI000A025F50|nr:sigma-70 family RNA polymerase sigma factor [Demequina sp. NBRC 110054]